MTDVPKRSGPLCKSYNTATQLCYPGHVLMENRTGLAVGTVVTHTDGIDERAAAPSMLDTVLELPCGINADGKFDLNDATFQAPISLIVHSHWARERQAARQRGRSGASARCRCGTGAAHESTPPGSGPG